MARLSLPRLRHRETPTELELLRETLDEQIALPTGHWAEINETLEAITALGAPGIDALTAALASPDRRLREVVAEHLRALKDPRLLGSLIVALRAKHSGVRAAAATAIAHLPDPRAADALARALADPSPDVRRRAAFALGERADPRAVPELVVLAEREPDPTAWEMVRWLALAHRPLPGVPPRLDPPPSVAEVAAVLRPVVDAVPGLDDRLRAAADHSVFELDGSEAVELVRSAEPTSGRPR